MRWENVIRKWMAVVWLLAVPHSTAAEIVAWKVPLTRFAIHGISSESMVRLKVPPEASPFFGAGDELWDLKGIPKINSEKEEWLPDAPPPRLETDPPLEWVVWNATSSTLVTKSDWSGIWQLHNRMNVLNQPKQCWVMVDVLEMPKDGNGLSEKEIPVSSLSCVVRSGQVAEAETHAGEKRMRAKLEPTISEDADLLDLGLELSYANPPRSGLNLMVQFALVPGQPVWVARESDGTSGLDVKVTALVELVDGTAFSDIVRVQDRNGWKNFVSQKTEPGRYQVGENAGLVVAFATPDLLEPHGSTGEDIDPFAEPPPSRHEAIAKYPEIQVPDALRPWFSERVLDMRELVKNAGIQVNEGDVTGCDPARWKFFFYSKSEQELDKFEALFTWGCNLRPKLLFSTFNGESAMRLVSMSGRKSTLVRSVEGKEIKRIEIEATLGETEELVDLRYFIHDQTSENKLRHLNSSASLGVGKWLELLGGNNDDSGKLRAKVEVTRL